MREEMSVRERYRAGSEEMYWVTPLSIPSNASTKSWYILSQRVLTTSESMGSPMTVEITSFPKCLEIENFHQFRTDRGREYATHL